MATTTLTHTVCRESAGWFVYDDEGFRVAGPYKLRSMADAVALYRTNDERKAAGLPLI